MEKAQIARLWREYVRRYGPVYAWSYLSADRPNLTLEQVLEALQG